MSETKVIDGEGGASNIDAYRIALAAVEAVETPHGDHIDIGLHLLNLLHKNGYTVIRDKQPGEW